MPSVNRYPNGSSPVIETSSAHFKHVTVTRVQTNPLIIVGLTSTLSWPHFLQCRSSSHSFSCLTWKPTTFRFWRSFRSSSVASSSRLRRSRSARTSKDIKASNYSQNYDLTFIIAPFSCLQLLGLLLMFFSQFFHALSFLLEGHFRMNKWFSTTKRNPERKQFLSVNYHIFDIMHHISLTELWTSERESFHISLREFLPKA